MANEPDAAVRPSIFVEASGAQTIAGADAQICAAGAAAPDDVVIWRCAPGQMVPDSALVCVADGGLAAATQLRAKVGSTIVVPRAEVQRTERRYGFLTNTSGSGFSTYQLDPATATGFDVADGGRSLPIADWLAEAVRLGFAEVWLHSHDAAAVGRGFAGDLLERAHRLAPALGFWLSGGDAAPADIERMVGRPGLVALVVSPQVLGVETPEISGTTSRGTVSSA